MTEKVRIHISDHPGVQGCSVPVDMIQILLFKTKTNIMKNTRLINSLHTYILLKLKVSTCMTLCLIFLRKSTKRPKTPYTFVPREKRMWFQKIEASLFLSASAKYNCEF